MTDKEIVDELIWLIAQRKGLVSITVNFEDGTSEKVLHASRNWIVEAARSLSPIVEKCRITP